MFGPGNIPLETAVIAAICNGLFFAAVGITALVTSHYRNEFRTFWYTRVMRGSGVSREEYYRIRHILQQHMSWFGRLGLEGQSKFITRVHRFMRYRKFEGIRGQRLTPEMPVLLSASAVQLTFGLTDYKLKFLKTVRIAPEPVYSRMFKGHLRGAVSPNGVLMVSWPDFLKGYREDADNFNLGLHEMAHALKLDSAQSSTFDLRFATYISEWLRIGEGAFKLLQQRTPAYLHEYGGNNKHEFFAVCVEHFFETPEQFSQELPDVYNHLCKLLNQNPLNTSGDYKLSAAFKKSIAENPDRIPLPEKPRNRYSPDAPNRFHSFIVSGMAVGLIAASINSGFEVIDSATMLYVGAAGALLAALIQVPYIFKHRALNLRWFPFYLLALFTLNVAGYRLFNSLYVAERYTATETAGHVKDLGNGRYELFFQVHPVEEVLRYKLNRYEGNPARLEHATATVYLSRGCMGFDIFEDATYRLDTGNP